LQASPAVTYATTAPLSQRTLAAVRLAETTKAISPAQKAKLVTSIVSPMGVNAKRTLTIVPHA
jgi:hypothetical protein